MIYRRRMIMASTSGGSNQHYDSDGNPIDTAVPALSLDITAVNDIMEDTTIPALTLTVELVYA